MTSKIYNICGIVGFILCLTLCLIFIPDIGALKFIGIFVLSLMAGISSLELSYFILYKFLEPTNPNEWKFAVLTKTYIDGTKKYQPVVKTIKFGYYINIDKILISSVSHDSEFDTYEEAEELIKTFKDLEIERYKEEMKSLYSNDCKSVKKPKVIKKDYTEV